MRYGLLGLAFLGMLVTGWLIIRPPAPPDYLKAVDCVDAYHRALKKADETAFLHCLDDELQTAYRNRHNVAGSLAKELRTLGRGLRNWVVLPDAGATKERMAVVIHQQYSDKRRQQKLHLERAGSSWRITRVEEAQELAYDIPFGTHVSQVPDANERSNNTPEAEPVP